MCIDIIIYVDQLSRSFLQFIMWLTLQLQDDGIVQPLDFNSSALK